MKDFVLNNIGTLAVVVLVLLVLMITAFVIVLCLLVKMKKNYKTFLSGSDGKSLEAVMLKRLKEVEALKEDSRKDEEQISELFNRLKYTYQKTGLEKYDAFKEMGGKLSFSLCLLNEENDGVILTSMHSTREGCYTYIKEIIKGESYVVLSKEEKSALEKAKGLKSKSN